MTAQYQPDQGFSRADFDAAQATIIDELSAVASLDAYFIEAMLCKTVMHTEVRGCLDACKNDFAGLTPGHTKVEIDLGELFGLLIDAVALTNPELEGIALLWRAAWFVGNLAADANEIPDTSAYSVFEATFNDLVTQLDSSFTGDANNLASIVSAVLSDGGKLAAITPLVEQRRLQWPHAGFKFTPDARIATKLEFVRRLMLATFKCYSSGSLFQIRHPCVEISTEIPAQFEQTGSTPLGYFASAIGSGSDREITVAPTPRLAEFIFTTAVVQDFWSWPWRSVPCKCSMQPATV